MLITSTDNKKVKDLVKLKQKNIEILKINLS